jgi:hypothetical protein
LIDSARCTRCERKVENSLKTCANPETFHKLSRAMESMGSILAVMDIWENCPNTYVAAIVTDEYAPEKEGNLEAKKPNHGELPLDHPFITKLSGQIHYVKKCMSELYQLVHHAKAKSKTCKADAMRLSRNLVYMIA